jgi:carboxyl-terminal processing protease
LKAYFKRITTWIFFSATLLLGLQLLLVLHHHQPELLRITHLNKPVHHLLSSLGLVSKDPLWELVQEGDRTRLKQALQSVDRYSTYLSPDQFNSFAIDSKQEYQGIGVSLMPHPRGAEVRDVFDGSPAEHAGIHVGDIIAGINDQSLDNRSFNSIIEQIRGSIGSELVLQVTRGDAQFNLNVERGAIDIPSIRDVQVTHDGLLYLRIEQFGEKSAREFLDTIHNRNSRALRGIVIDLRENTGGVMSSAISMLDAFFEPGEIMLQTRNTDNERQRTYRARQPRIIGNIPVAILVSRNSASASEILAGSLQVTGKATIIGERTLGKGSIQTVYLLRKGDAYKRTSSYYYFPDGSSIHEVGIDPDIRISLSNSDYHRMLRSMRMGFDTSEAGNDPFMQAARSSLASAGLR